MIYVRLSKEKAKLRIRYNQVPHLTQDTTWERDTNTRKHHVQESQEASSFPAGGHKAAMNRQTRKINDEKGPHENTALERQ